MKIGIGLSLLVAVIMVLHPNLGEAQQPKVYRVGVITAGGAWYEVIDGLRAGLKQLGFEEEKQFTLAIRDTKGNAKAAEEAAKNLEQEKVNLIYTTQTSVTLATKRATADIPIVFCAGADPVILGLVESFAKTGGKTHRRLLPGHRPHREAPRDPERDYPKVPPGSDILRPAQSCCQ
jgi:ABC-type uncharacterized transport system substrate-binding protein